MHLKIEFFGYFKPKNYCVEKKLNFILAKFSEKLTISVKIQLLFTLTPSLPSGNIPFVTWRYPGARMLRKIDENSPVCSPNYG